MGLLGLDPETFWGLTLRDYFIKRQAYRDKLEDLERVVRLQTYWIVSPNFKPEEKVQPSDLWTLPSEMAEKALEEKRKEEQAELMFLRSLGFQA